MIDRIRGRRMVDKESLLSSIAKVIDEIGLLTSTNKPLSIHEMADLQRYAGTLKDLIYALNCL